MRERRKPRRGVYRISYPGGLVSDVLTQAVEGDDQMTIAEPLYRARGYAPPFDDLPSQRDYFEARKNEQAAT